MREESEREAMMDVCVQARRGECEERKRKRKLYPFAPRYGLSMFRKDNTIKKRGYIFALYL